MIEFSSTKDAAIETVFVRFKNPHMPLEYV